MDEREKEAPGEPQRTTVSSANDQGGEQAALEGKKAIEAGRLSDDKPASDEEKAREEEKDAEKWRNEG